MKNFALKNARLAQRDILGTDGKLIGPWDMTTALRPGTLVVVEANLIVYSFSNTADTATVCVCSVSFQNRRQMVI